MKRIRKEPTVYNNNLGNIKKTMMSRDNMHHILKLINSIQLIKFCHLEIYIAYI